MVCRLYFLLRKMSRASTRSLKSVWNLRQHTWCCCLFCTLCSGQMISFVIRGKGVTHGALCVARECKGEMATKETLTVGGIQEDESVTADPFPRCK